ncbi:MAG: bifunctional NADH-specific enoyl-ACP reductase/trans-2-enoyl-CoA reductase, partial [Spirochaetales bacterium]
MIVKPMVRNNICLNAHPTGCEALVNDWIERTVASRGSIVEAALASGKPLPKAVLVLGCSTGYGLATRIGAAFACGASTIGVSFEREPNDKKPASAGWYDNRAFDRAAKASGLYSVTYNLDAFSDLTRAEVIRRARLDGLQFDQVIYSLASPVRVDPKTGVMHKSTLKPLGTSFSGTTVDAFTGVMSEVSVKPASEDEAAETVKVMGGEDWELWIRALADADVLARGCVTMAYSYMGPEHSWPVYRYGTIGRAKEHLERTAPILTGVLKDLGGKAFVSI